MIPYRHKFKHIGYKKAKKFSFIFTRNYRLTFWNHNFICT